MSLTQRRGGKVFQIMNAQNLFVQFQGLLVIKLRVLKYFQLLMFVKKYNLKRVFLIICRNNMPALSRSQFVQMYNNTSVACLSKVLFRYAPTKSFQSHADIMFVIVCHDNERTLAPSQERSLTAIVIGCTYQYPHLAVNVDMT